jgi:hypothetical protein
MSATAPTHAADVAAALEDRNPVAALLERFGGDEPADAGANDDDILLDEWRQGKFAAAFWQSTSALDVAYLNCSLRPIDRGHPRCPGRSERVSV